MVSSTAGSFLECQKLMAIIICLITIIIYTQFILFYFASNEAYDKIPIFTKYLSNSFLVICMFMSQPLWRSGTKRMLLKS